MHSDKPGMRRSHFWQIRKAKPLRFPSCVLEVPGETGQGITTWCARCRGTPRVWSLTGCVSDQAADRTSLPRWVLPWRTVRPTGQAPATYGPPHQGSLIALARSGETQLLLRVLCLPTQGRYVSSFPSGVTCSKPHAVSELGGHISRLGHSKVSLKTL